MNLISLHISQALLFFALLLSMQGVSANSNAAQETIQDASIQKTSPSLSLLIEREEEKRQRILNRSNDTLKSALDLEGKGAFEAAAKKCRSVLRWTENVQGAEVARDSARTLLRRILIEQANQAIRRNDHSRAEACVDELLKLDPLDPQAILLYDTLEGNTSAEESSSAIHSQRAMQEAESQAKISRLQRALARARESVRQGALDPAQKILEKALSSRSSVQGDPYYSQAARELIFLEIKKKAALEASAQTAMNQYDTAVRGQWTAGLGDEPLPMVDALSSIQAQANSTSGREKITSKLQFIVVSEIQWSGADLREAADFLTEESRRLDPDGIGVSFLVHEDAETQANPITLRLSKVPLNEILRYMTRLAEVRCKIEEQAVFLLPLKSDHAHLMTREFWARQQFFHVEKTVSTQTEENDALSASSPRPAQSSAPDPIRQSLEAKGVVFGPGATAIYSPSTGILTARNTEDQLDYIEQLIQGDAPALGVAKVIQIETRVLEISQTDLNDISFNWSIEGGTLPGGIGSGQHSGIHGSSTSARAETRLGTASTLPMSSLESIVGNKASSTMGQSISENTLYVSGFLDGTTFTMLLNALSQKKSANWMSAPTVLMNSGGSGSVIEVVREIKYPTAFNPPRVELPQRSVYTDASGNAITLLAGPVSPIAVPAWPTQFSKEPRKVGIRMEVKKAQADETNQKISLELAPEITDFEGFIDYGSKIYTVVGYQGEPIADSDPNGAARRVLSDNRIRVPVFSVRSFDEGFKLDVRDGYTMALGGLIREERQTLNEKVPVLGDIPLLGSLFRSKAERSIRKNLILFVTPRILQPNGEPVNPQ